MGVVVEDNQDIGNIEVVVAEDIQDIGSNTVVEVPPLLRW